MKVIQGLDNGKACGLDGIDVRILKAGSPVLSVHLSTIFNMSITCGKVPKCWKIKRVTPLFKKGDTSDLNNYRPISILSISMKIFEKIIHRQLYDFLSQHNIISRYQSGFRDSHSTETAVIHVSDYILDQLSQGKFVGAILVDLKKAFDTVDHRILLKKLFCYGVRDISFDWFESYLNDRSQCTILNGIQSDFINEEAYGVPQGSVLGPLLFLIYINNINESIHESSVCHLYADDTIVIQSFDSQNSLHEGLSKQIESLGTWFIRNKLTVNTDKTECCKALPPISL